MINNWYFKAN